MRKQLSFRDTQALSEYLDGKLSPTEKSRIETRLMKEADLRDELETLRRTRILLRNSPKIRAPHNFTLTRHMAGIREKPRFGFGYPFLKFSTVLASILFVIALLGDFLVKQPMPMSPQFSKEIAPAAENMQEAESEPVEEYAVEQEMAGAYPTMTSAPGVASPTEGAVEKAFELSNVPMEPLPSTMPSMLTMESTSEAIEEAPAMAAEPEEAREGVTALGAEEAETEHALSDTGAVTDQALETDDSIAESSTEELVSVYGEESEAPAPYLEESQPQMDIWRMLKIIFGILFVILGLSMLVYRSKRKI